MIPVRRVRAMAPVAVALGSLMSCIDPTLPVLDPIEDVTVYTFTVVEAGDTVRVHAEGFREGNGFGVEVPRVVQFASSDTTIFRVEGVGGLGSTQPNALVRGVRPGLATLSATLNGVTGADTLRVIPVIHSFALHPSTATIGIGDSVRVHARANDANGDSISARTSVTLDSAGALMHTSTGWLRGVRAGVMTMHAELARSVARGTVTVVASP